MTKPPFQLHMPQLRSTSVIFASPHSGRAYPRPFLARTVLDGHSIRSSEDAYVDRIFAGVPALGAPLIAAEVPRAYVDLNRSVDELDPALVEGVRRSGHNPRITSGLGVIPRVVANGRAIYGGKLTRAEAEARLGEAWLPYHEALALLVAQSVEAFGEAILIDCHSMPHEAIENVGGVGGARPDVVLGDRFGAAADPQIVDHVEAAFVAAGLRVARNAPFAGAFTAQQYGRPARGQHVVQVEIDRALYMDEATIRPHAGYRTFCVLIEQVTADIVQIGARRIPLAAE
jgi:N-formylglutamate deformylase